MASGKTGPLGHPLRPKHNPDRPAAGRLRLSHERQAGDRLGNGALGGEGRQGQWHRNDANDYVNETVGDPRYPLRPPPRGDHCQPGDDEDCQGAAASGDIPADCRYRHDRLCKAAPHGAR